MTPALRFSVHGVAQPKGSTRAFVPKGWTRPIVTSANKGLKGWEETIRHTLQDVLAKAPRPVRDALFEAPVAVTLVFYLPRPKASKGARYSTKKPDLDKLVRGANDAMTGLVYRDDAQVVAIGARKCYADGAARLDVSVEAWSA